MDDPLGQPSGNRLPPWRTPVAWSEAASFPSPAPSVVGHGTEPPQILLILVGLPGSGKTTFAEALVRSTEPGQDAAACSRPRQQAWIRASQDDAPNRRRQECESRVRWGLREGYNVVVDRVGFDAVQRSHFIAIADHHRPRPQVWCLVLSVSPDTLERRLITRETHPTIPDAETGLRVLRQMWSQFSPPSVTGTVAEGFDRVHVLDEREQPVDGKWSRQKLESILDHVESRGIKESGQRRALDRGEAPYRRGHAPDPGSRGWARGRGASRARPLPSGARHDGNTGQGVSTHGGFAGTAGRWNVIGE
ncbi:hypothetical protein IAU60_005153 [Kwoniella sp. DSM 27419]